MALRADAVVALMGVVYCGDGAYLVARDSCFLAQVPGRRKS